MDAGCVRLEPGAALDLGGIGKGFSATRALHAMRWAAPSVDGGLVDLGGDIAVSGCPPDGAYWRVALADARRPGATLGTLAIFDGGVATSGRDRRRFGPGRTLHHLIDPATGAPAAAGPLAVTVVAPDAAEAEAHATALAISTLEQAREHLANFPTASALYVPAAGEPTVVGDLPLLEPGAGRMNGVLANAPVAWYVARAAGLVAFGLLTLSVWLGLGMSTRLATRFQKRLFGWHQTLAWTGLAMLGLHAGALLFDPTLHFGLPSVLVPFASSWRPDAVAAGVVGGWLTLMLAVSFRLRRWIGQKGWRRLHYASFVAFFLALGHALTAGSDLKGVSGPVLAALAAGPVVWLTFYRILAPRPSAKPVPRMRPSPDSAGAALS